MILRVKKRGFSLSKLVLLLSLALSSARAVSPVCSYNRQCDDGDPDTLDFCYASFNRCYNILRQIDANGTASFVPTTLSKLIEDANEKPLSTDEKRKIISAAALLLGELSPNRFLQLNFLKVDIVQELNSFAASLSTPSLADQSNFEFHQRMIHIFQMMDDLHSSYLAPVPLNVSFAILGFRIQTFFVPGEKDENGQPLARYAIADTVPGFTSHSPSLKVGAEILKWNGKDISTVINRFGENGYGSNPAAQRVRALDQLTFRWLGINPVPDSDEVEIELRSQNDIVFTETVKWFYTVIEPDSKQSTSPRMIVPSVRLLRKRRSSEQKHHKPRQQFGITIPDSPVSPTLIRLAQQNRTIIKVVDLFEEVLAAEIVHTRSGPIGRLILPSFRSLSFSAFQAEVTRILRLMPKGGLVLDARNNLGGYGRSAELVTKLATGTDVEPLARTFRATNFSLKLSKLPFPTANTPAIETALKAGERFTGPYFFGDPGGFGVSQVYHGPVVSLVNGRTYSAGDIFASLQVDKNASLLVGTSDNVGGGGASRISYDRLSEDLPDMFEPLPGGVTFSTAFERFYRRGWFAGALVENFGIKPDLRYLLSLNDAVNEDYDLFEFLVKCYMKEWRQVLKGMREAPVHKEPKFAPALQFRDSTQ